MISLFAFGWGFAVGLAVGVIVGIYLVTDETGLPKKEWAYQWQRSSGR